MEQFLATGLIVLAFSSWASSKEEYIMETPDCRTCTWDWDTSAFLRFSGLISPVFPRFDLMTSPCSSWQYLVLVNLLTKTIVATDEAAMLMYKTMAKIRSSFA